MSFKIRSLTLAVATFSAMSAHSAGLDRSGQDITGFLQDGTYADVIYTHIDADISGKDRGIDGKGTNPKEIKDIAPSYDFFRYNVKTDVNDRISVGVLYDEPFGAKVEYTGDNNFTGAANLTATGVIAQMLGEENIAKASVAGAVLNAKAEAIDAAGGSENEINAYSLMSVLFSGTGETLNELKDAVDGGMTQAQLLALLKQEVPTKMAESQAAIRMLETLLQDPDFTPANKAEIEKYLSQYEASAARLAQSPAALENMISDNGGTNVEVHTRNLTGLVGVKLGEKRNVQVYAGPALQRLEGEVHLRGNSYQQATGYDAQITPDTAVGWVAGVAYSKPEIALKASLTYRSEIDHKTDISEFYPLAPLASLPQQTNQAFKVTTPESYNLDFQTGLSAKHRLLGTAKVRYVPWSDFAITPPLYNQVSKSRYPDGLNIVDYAKDQWSAEIGLAKQVNNKLAVSGTVGWDSGAGNPATSLGPIKGYYSVGFGAKYNITPEWSLSAGAKYLKFGDATARLPDGTTEVGDFENNDGYIVGVKLAYQKK